METKPWMLVADIGGTNARFGVYDQAEEELAFVKSYRVVEHQRFEEALSHFVDDVIGLGLWHPYPMHVCLAVACPIDGDLLSFTNSPWQVDRLLVSKFLGNAPTKLINDFTAVGYAVSNLKLEDWLEIHPGEAFRDKPIAILGPGTGLGVSTLIPLGEDYKVIEGEGGHVDFAPVDPHEIAILEKLTAQFGRVSVERLLSGSGIVNIYRCLAELAHREGHWKTPEEITQAARVGTDTLAVRTMQVFFRLLGSVAGDLALTLGAKGGIYIAGGIVPRFADLLVASEFNYRFEAKGRFREYLNTIPVRLVVKENLGLYGAAASL
ncbi:glucokinase [Zhongshania aquimaris]|uniref:Glucokinase n=1 Tax=Zhongshania aquimaris TaxID=2857107 RepID=A0ABS6VX37_9GAMM|nr:glucokinase [Zhongshania aquimaris]MBW2942235.1 glucokinase [Zhongshania aquimaris]